MNTSLLTRDGFPRSDIDVAQSKFTAAEPMPSAIYVLNIPKFAPLEQG